MTVVHGEGAGVVDAEVYKAVATGGGLPRVTAHSVTFSLCDLRQTEVLHPSVFHSGNEENHFPGLLQILNGPVFRTIPHSLCGRR